MKGVFPLYRVSVTFRVSAALHDVVAFDNDVIGGVSSTVLGIKDQVVNRVSINKDTIDVRVSYVDDGGHLMKGVEQRVTLRLIAIQIDDRLLALNPQVEVVRGCTPMVKALANDVDGTSFVDEVTKAGRCAHGAISIEVMI